MIPKKSRVLKMTLLMSRLRLVLLYKKNNEKENAKRKATADQSITTKPAKNKKPKNDDIQEVIKQSIIQRQKRAEERAVERAVQKPLDDDLYHFYMSMYKITKKMSPKFQHRARNDVFQAISQLEAAYLEMQDPSQENYTHSEQRVFTGAYVNTHIQQPPLLVNTSSITKFQPQ
ncbi:uncharacterized protein LOC114330349 [Diabrotica virgifera virgifera]|uniref:BESS domain-containing protein n=1 Tax=Diabrotica virgifera virgifera TaxID=50390 RepID=A0ABM5IL99_DIAVI|nr:uncharacterized protein LOC114330349 [Diabrotica virgifera virgifera]